MAAAPASCMSAENGCVMFDCLVHLWEWLDPPIAQSQFQMENKKQVPATQQPLMQQHLMAQHVHADQIYNQHHPPIATHLSSPQPGQLPPNGVMHQLLQSQYHSNIDARSPLLENRHELYGTGYNQDYARQYGVNDNYNYPQSPPRLERTELHTDHNVNNELLHNIPKGYNAEVYQDYLKRNPPKDTNQIYQNHQPTYRPNSNQYGSKPYLPYSSRIGPHSNTELLRRQYNEIQQMKLQQQLHYQNQAQMHQQQKFAERQMLLQQIHGVQPPPNLQNSIYSDSSYRDLDRYSSKNDFKEYSSTDIQKDIDRYAKNNEFRENDKQSRQYPDPQWQSNQQTDFREPERYRRQSEGDKGKSQSPPSDQSQKSNVGIVSPMKSSESSSPSVKSPSSDSRRSSGGTQALRSPIAQRLPSAPVTMSGILYKQGSDGLKVWRKRWFVLSEYCLFYYKSHDEEKLLGSVLLPSYKVSACTADDKVLRKFAFKLEHANMRTYILCAPDQEAMMKWVKALTMAALMQSPNDQPQKQSGRAAAKTEEDEIPGPTYANAPPKPRRSNEGYNSPGSDIYDPNYDLLKQPASHYSQGTSHTRYQEHNYPSSPNQESIYTRSPQSPPAPPQYPTKRPYDTHHLSLPLTNTVTDRLENNQPSTSTSMYKTTPNSPYFDTRSRTQQEPKQEQIYDRQPQSNPFLQDTTPETEGSRDNDMQNTNSRNYEHERAQSKTNDKYPESRLNNISNVDMGQYSRDVYGELNARPSRSGSAMNERLLIERRTPDAYGRSTTMSAYSKDKVGDYEDVYATYATENDYGQTYAKSPNMLRDATNISSQIQQQSQDPSGNYTQEKTFSGPSVLRRKKMQSSGIQPQMPRPHSADFLEYESKNEMLNRSMANRTIGDVPRQPQRPKSSLDINSSYDPSSDRYYSEESYAEKMRQSAQYLQQGLGPRNIQIPLAKYASGLVEKQLHSPYSHATNNNYETEFGSPRNTGDNTSNHLKFNELMNSNWTLKNKDPKDYLNSSGSVMSDGSNISGYVKGINRSDTNNEGFMRSASARLPSTAPEREGEKKVQQREESMKRLLEWKQRMLQSPLTRKSTPATISLARSLNQSRQSLKDYKSKTYNASYNSYSSDDEEETSGTELQKLRNMQAGRSQKENVMSPIVTEPISPHASPTAKSTDSLVENADENINSTSNNINSNITENAYENVRTMSNLDHGIEKYNNNSENNEDTRDLETSDKPETEDGYETHESEAESESQMEYTDNDLDEVLLETQVENVGERCDDKNIQNVAECEESVLSAERQNKSETPPIQTTGEDHYLPMSPRKVSTVEPAHKVFIQNLSVFDQTMPQCYEDNPYVEMNLGNDDDDLQTYEVVCVNNGRVEPVYMELTNVLANETSSSDATIDAVTLKRASLDTASNFADTKDHTLKRISKTDKVSKEVVKTIDKQTYCSDADDEASKEISLDSPFNRFSISDTFRPASYYLSSSSSNVLDLQDSSDSEVFPPPPVPSSSPPCDELSDDALSKYILDKLDQSDMSQDNSILKMLTNEKQKMNTAKRRTTSLMIYGSRTSIHDTLSRGEKARSSRASLTLERNKANDSQSSILRNSILERTNSSSIESDSLKSYNADRGSSRLSLESDISSKFEMTPSNNSSEVASLNGSESALELRHSNSYRDLEMIMKRRPLSDDSLFELEGPEIRTHNDCVSNIDLDRYLDNLQPSPSNSSFNNINNQHFSLNNTDHQCNIYKDNINQAINLQTTMHMRCSSTPVASTNKKCHTHLSDSQCSSVGMPKSEISYYCKDYDEEKILAKNLNKDVSCDKIKDFECEKLSVSLTGIDTNASSSTTGFHSRESSTEHSAPYYYSDLSSQEHINVLPTSHYLKNTNLHRKLNNQRRRGPLHKKNEISHIHNPIRKSQAFAVDHHFELAASARSVSVEFLSAADKDPEIDLKNIYESSGGKHSKIPESLTLMSGLNCKITSGSILDSSSPESNNDNRSTLNISSPVQLSTASMSSHCSGTSSNTVYYDAEAEASAYENIMCQGEKHWEEDSLWRDNLRRVSHRHARSMDDLDTVTTESTLVPTGRTSVDVCAMNSIKRIKKDGVKKLSRNVTYVNCDIQNQVLRRRDNSMHNVCNDEQDKVGENDVYVSLAQNTGTSVEPSDEGVYEQLAVESLSNSLKSRKTASCKDIGKGKKKFEIDREKLRQWDLMSSGLMKGGMGRVRGAGGRAGAGDALCSTDSGADSASNEASMTITGNNMESGTNNSNHQALSKKAFLGSNTSIGRSNRDSNIPVRAVSPRVRWVEEKPTNEQYGSEHLTGSQQNLRISNATEDSWATGRSPSRASQQPIRAVSPRVRRSTEHDDMQREPQSGQQLGEVPTAGELLGRTHEELVLLLIQLRRRHTATHRAIEQCCAQINSIKDCLSSVKAMEREESLHRLEHLKMQLMELEHQYEKSKPLVQLVDNMVKLGSLYNRPGSTVERLERNQRLRQKVLAEHALEQQRWLESAAAGKQLETEAARARVAELWALEQELADEAAILQGLRTDKDAIESLLTGVRGKLDSVQTRSDLSHITNQRVSAVPELGSGSLEAELARVHAMLALNSKKLEQTVADNARLERELQQLRRALQARRAAAPAHPPPAHATAMLEDEVSRVQHLVSALQRQRQELSRAVRHLTQQSHALQTTHDSLPGKRRPTSSWQETNLDTGHTTDHGNSDYDYDMGSVVMSPGNYESSNMDVPLYVDTRGGGNDVMSPMTSEEMQNGGFANLSNVEKQEIKTVRIVKRESERRQRDRERSLQPMSDWPSNNITANLDQFLEEELIQSSNYSRASSVPRTDFSKFEEYYSKPQPAEPPNYLRLNEKMSSMELSPKYPSSPSLSNYDYSRDISSLSSSYNRSYEKSGYDKTISISTQYLNSPTDSARTLTNDPLSKTSSIGSLTRSHMELSPIFKSEAAKQIITEMSGDVPKNGSLHRRQVPKEKRRHYTAPHHLSAKTLNEMPKEAYNQDKLGRSLDDADMERALRAPPDVVRSALAPPQRYADSIDQLLAAPQKILIPERYIPEKVTAQLLGRSLDADMERALRAPPDVVRSALAPPQRYADSIDQLLAAPQKILIPERYIPEKVTAQLLGRSLDADMERALRAPPDVVRSALAPPQRYADSIDQLLAAPQKILIPERYIPEKVTAQLLGRSLDADMERALRAPPDVVRSALAPPQRYADSIDQLLAAPQKILIPERYIPEKVTAQLLGRSLDADMERALRAPPDVVRSALAPPQRYADSIDQLLAAPQKILIPERYIPEKPPELSPEEQQKRQEKVESIKKMLSGSTDPNTKSPDGEDKRQREHLLQMNQLLAKQVTEMSKIIAVKALEELPQRNNADDLDDRSPDVELPIYQQRDNFFT